MSNVQLHNADCLDVMRGMDANSVDAVVTDPPYGLKFMGKRWDCSVPGVDVWVEELRVLKPGGHMLCFAGTRTQHRMACAIEDGGFEIRDMIAWVYGTGFPKSLDVSKAIDKAAGAEREIVGNWKGGGYGGGSFKNSNHAGHSTKNGESNGAITAPETEGARQWNGFGTALKPSHEPVTWATKPLPYLAHCAIMIENLTREIQSCSQNASSAGKSLERTHQESSAGTTNTVRGNVEIQHGECRGTRTQTGRAGGISSEAATSESEKQAKDTGLSMLLSWKNTLAEICGRAKTSTISTEFETIIDWKTLSLCLSQNMPACIIGARLNLSGPNVSAPPAVQYLSASFALLETTLTLSVLAPAMSQEAQAFQDGGVKPNLSPITLARKPLIETVAANVLEHGTGALNIDGCRVGNGSDVPLFVNGVDRVRQRSSYDTGGSNRTGEMSQQGRWPANLIHDGSDEVLEGFPETGASRAAGFHERTPDMQNAIYGGNALNASGTMHIGTCEFGDSGSAARFFYCAKASSDERGEDNAHPCVKPIALMRYLCRLITPPGGVVLDPFMGSGSTGVAAVLEGFGFVGSELDATYFETARKRIKHAEQEPKQMELCDD